MRRWKSGVTMRQEEEVGIRKETSFDDAKKSNTDEMQSRQECGGWLD